MKILLTGSAGFIGAHVVEHLLKTTDWTVGGVDSLQHKGNLSRVDHLLCERYTFSKIDLAQPNAITALEDLGERYDVIINMASESHVDRSIADPVPFVRNNVDLTLNLLEYARETKPSMFIQISTDEVYGPLVDSPHPEWATMLPSNPYSASKAAQEALAIAYWRTYGVPVIITNTMNNFGERQDKEKFVPMVIDKVQQGEVVTIHGNKDQIGTRFYLHARNHADALRFLIQRGSVSMYPAADRPDRYNVAGDIELTNLQMAQLIAAIVGKPLKYQLLDFHAARPGHDARYGLDGTKIAKLGWKAPAAFYDSLRKTVAWTLDHQPAPANPVNKSNLTI